MIPTTSAQLQTHTWTLSRCRNHVLLTNFAIMARRFKLDYQTFQFICLIGVPSVGIYFYGKTTQKAPGELEKHLESNYKRQVTAARRNNQALKEFWAKNGGVGKFNAETEAQMDRVLRGGKTKGHAPGNRINHDNIAFHEAKKSGVALPTSSK